MERVTPLPRPVWERHFQTFVGLAMLALGTWLIDSTLKQNVALAVQTERIKALTLRIDRLAILSSGLYTSNDAERDFALRDAVMVRIRERIRILERGAR